LELVGFSLRRRISGGGGFPNFEEKTFNVGFIFFQKKPSNVNRNIQKDGLSLNPSSGYILVQCYSKLYSATLFFFPKLFS